MLLQDQETVHVDRTPIFSPIEFSGWEEQSALYLALYHWLKGSLNNGTLSEAERRRDAILREKCLEVIQSLKLDHVYLSHERLFLGLDRASDDPDLSAP